MMFEGYRLNGYNATYCKSLFSIIERGEQGSGVMEITDIDTGITFIIEIEKESKLYEQYNKENKKRARTRGWMSEVTQDSDRSSEQQGFKQRFCGKSITFGGASRSKQSSFHAERNDKPMS